MTEKFFTNISFYVLLILVLLTGCSASAGKGSNQKFLANSPAGRQQPARLSVFLHLLQPSAPEVSITISSVEVLSEETWLPLSSRPIAIHAAQVGGGQMFVAGNGIPVGSIDRLRFAVEKASIVKGGKEMPLISDAAVVEMVLPVDLDIGKGDSETIFVTWDVLASLQGTTSITPVMTAVSQNVRLTTDLAYVACPEIDTVYVIRTDNNRVVGSIGIQGGPIYLAIEPSQNRLYVLTGRDADIKVIEITSNRVIDRFKIPLVYDPFYMIVSQDGLWAYIIENRSEYLSKVDLRSGSLAERVNLGVEPNYLLSLDEHRQLAVSAALSNEVLLLDPDSLSTLGVITVGSAPQGLAVWERFLYVAESGANKVTVYDLESRTTRNRLNVGSTPKRILATDNRIYVTNSGDKSLSVFMPSQFAAYKKIPLGGVPLEMAAEVNQRWLYVGEGGSKGLRIIDPTSGQVAGFIELGTVPVGISVLQ